MAFGLDMNSEMGILLERVISKLQEETDGNYTTDHIIKGIRKFDFPKETQEGLVNRFMAAQDWGFSARNQVLISSLQEENFQSSMSQHSERCLQAGQSEL